MQRALAVRPRTRLLLAGATAAATTANAIRPLPRSSALSLPAFALGLPVSELPLQVGLLELASLLALGRNGATRGWGGKVGVAAFAASVAGLAFVHRQAAGAGPVLEEALVEALGPGYRDRIAEPFLPREEVPLTRHRLLVPDMRVRKRYRAARDVPYADLGKRNFLDVWRRADLPPEAKAPVLVQIPGGGWTTGRKEGQAEPLMAHLAERGWVCVTANYRLSPHATWPDHIVDVKRALAWTKTTVPEYGGDPGFVAITGGSAGGHLASLAALTSDVAAFQPGFEDADTSVAAAVPLYGVYDFTNRDGTRRAGMEQFLARVVFKSKLDDDRPRWEQASSVTPRGPRRPTLLRHPRHQRLAGPGRTGSAPSWNGCARSRPSPSSTRRSREPSTPSSPSPRLAAWPRSTPSNASSPTSAASTRRDRAPLRQRPSPPRADHARLRSPAGRSPDPGRMGGPGGLARRLSSPRGSPSIPRNGPPGATER